MCAYGTRARHQQLTKGHAERIQTDVDAGDV